MHGRENILICLVLLAAVHSVQAQSNDATISGFVYDADSGEVLIGCNVYLEDIQLGTTTNLHGFYTLPRVPVGAHRP